MFLLLVIFFTVFTVRCDDLGSLFVVELPEDQRARPFRAYWNVPTMQCRSKGVAFPDLREYGIVQNAQDRFQGERVAILYDPGKFPALLQNGSEWVARNGGVPQEGDLQAHLRMFEADVERYVPESFRVFLKFFLAYWNAPTMQCRSKGVAFPDLREYGIVQNAQDRFQGERVAILYDPGKFPALLQNGSEWVARNGGVPQEGDLQAHLRMFEADVERYVPESFRGVGIIDFESWRPIFRQNFGSLTYYKEVSYSVERKKHPFWPTSWIKDEAARRFEDSGRQFMLSTLSLARRLRPHAVWGYYGFPYCFNMSPSNRRQQCANGVPEENDRLSWLWEESTALFPSLYSPKELTSQELQQLVRGRVLEARRMRRRGRILPYFWYRYRDGGFISEKDLQNTLATLYESPASGLMLWGSSNDVNTKEKCLALLKYVENVLGPAVAKYTKNERIDEDNLLQRDGPMVEAGPATTTEEMMASSASAFHTWWHCLVRGLFPITTLIVAQHWTHGLLFELPIL